MFQRTKYVLAFAFAVFFACKEGGKSDNADDGLTGDFKNDCSIKSENRLISTIFLEDKFSKKYIKALLEYSVDTIHVKSNRNFQSRALDIVNSQIYLTDNYSERYPILNINYLDECYNGDFDLGDAKIGISGSFKKEKGLYAVTIKEYIEID